MSSQTLVMLGSRLKHPCFMLRILFAVRYFTAQRRQEQARQQLGAAGIIKAADMPALVFSLL